MENTNQIKSLVEKRLEEFKADITADYEGENKLGLNLYSTGELIEMGFVKTNVQKIMKDVPVPDMRYFFEKFVRMQTPITMGHVELINSDAIQTIGDFLDEFVKQSVFVYLNINLSDFVKSLKENQK